VNKAACRQPECARVNWYSRCGNRAPPISTPNFVADREVRPTQALHGGACLSRKQIHLFVNRRNSRLALCMKVLSGIFSQPFLTVRLSESKLAVNNYKDL
jgi:hypothetical protein